VRTLIREEDAIDDLLEEYSYKGTMVVEEAVSNLSRYEKQVTSQLQTTNGTLKQAYDSAVCSLSAARMPALGIDMREERRTWKVRQTDLDILVNRAVNQIVNV
jgi:hypothetical protein